MAASLVSLAKVAANKAAKSKSTPLTGHGAVVGIGKSAIPTSTPADKQVTKTATAKAAPAPSPYLTPSQMATYEKDQATQQTAINTDIGTENTDLSTLNSDESSNTTAYGSKEDADNWALSARGLGQSSIRDSDLNDLAATYTKNAIDYTTTFNTNLTKLGTAINTAQSNQSDLTNEYNETAVTNAEAETPTVGTNNAVNSTAPGSNYSLNLNPLVAADGVAPTSQAQVTSAATNPVPFSTPGTPTADQALQAANNHGNSYMTNSLHSSQVATATNPALAAIASQRAGFSLPGTTSSGTATGAAGTVPGAAGMAAAPVAAPKSPTAGGANAAPPVA